jgi:hypothetical protein
VDRGIAPVPSGFTPLRDATNTYRLAISYKIRAGDNSVVFPGTGTNLDNAVGRVLVFSGVDGQNTLDQTTPAATTSIALTKFHRQSIVECHFLDGSPSLARNQLRSLLHRQRWEVFFNVCGLSENNPIARKKDIARLLARDVYVLRIDCRR